MKLLNVVWLTIGLFLGAWGFAHGSDQVISTEVIKTKDAKGNLIEKHIVKKLRARNVVDFEEASIEGKVKKPNASYLLHGADLEFKHLYRIRNNQREHVLGSYEYVR